MTRDSRWSILSFLADLLRNIYELLRSDVRVTGYVRSSVGIRRLREDKALLATVG